MKELERDQFKEKANKFQEDYRSSDRFSWIGLFETFDELQRPCLAVYLAERKQHLDTRDILSSWTDFSLQFRKDTSALPYLYFLQGDVGEPEIPELTENVRHRFNGDPEGNLTRFTFGEYIPSPYATNRITDTLLQEIPKDRGNTDSHRDAILAFLRELANIEGPQAYLIYSLDLNLQTDHTLEIAALWSHPLSKEAQEQHAILYRAFEKFTGELGSTFLLDGLEIVSSSDFESIDDFKDHFAPQLYGPVPIIPLQFFTLDELRNGSKSDIETISFERKLVPAAQDTQVEITSSIPLETLSSDEVCDLCESKMQAVTLAQTINGKELIVKSPTPGYRCTNSECGHVCLSLEGALETLTKASLIFRASSDTMTAEKLQASIAVGKQILAIDRRKS